MAETAEQIRRTNRPRYRLGTSNSGVRTVTPSNAAARRDMRQSNPVDRRR